MSQSHESRESRHNWTELYFCVRPILTWTCGLDPDDVSSIIFILIDRNAHNFLWQKWAPLAQINYDFEFYCGCACYGEWEICTMHEYVQWPFDLMVQTVAIESITWCSCSLPIKHTYIINTRHWTSDRIIYIFLQSTYSCLMSMLWMR